MGSCGSCKLRGTHGYHDLGGYAATSMGMVNFTRKHCNFYGSMPAMSTSSDVDPLLGGTVELHPLCRFESRTLRVKTYASAFVGAGVGGGIIIPPWGRRLGGPVLR